jgi:hypothetical protein
LAKEATNSKPQWQYQQCGYKFTSCKAIKRHQYSISIKKSGKRRDTKAKGKSKANTTINKPKVPPKKTPTTPLTHKYNPLPFTALEVAQRGASITLIAMGPATYFGIPDKGTSICHLIHINTTKKRGT